MIFNQTHFCMGYFKIIYWVIILVFLGSVSCTPQKVNQSSTDRLYTKSNNELDAKYTIYHVNDSISQLFYDISNEVLQYKKTDTSNYFYAQIRIELNVSAEDNLSAVSDTASIVLTDKQEDAIIKQLRGSLFFKFRRILFSKF